MRVMLLTLWIYLRSMRPSEGGQVHVQLGAAAEPCYVTRSLACGTYMRRMRLAVDC